jgi:hypothetical protein
MEKQTIRTITLSIILGGSALFLGNSKVDLPRSTLVVIDGKAPVSQVEEEPEPPSIAPENDPPAEAIEQPESRQLIPRSSADPNALYRQVNARYGVDWQILKAIHQVETGQSGDTCRKSCAGATGPMQFLPSTWAKFGIDGDGDGQANICSLADSMYAAGHYLGASLQADGNYEKAIFAYNHALWYVEKVEAIAREIGWDK